MSEQDKSHQDQPSPESGKPPETEQAKKEQAKGVSTGAEEGSSPTPVPRRPRRSSPPPYYNRRRTTRPRGELLAFLNDEHCSTARLRQAILGGLTPDAPPALWEFLHRMAAELYVHEEILGLKVARPQIEAAEVNALIDDVMTDEVAGVPTPTLDEIQLDRNWSPYSESADFFGSVEAALGKHGLGTLYAEVLASRVCPDVEQWRSADLFRLLRADLPTRLMAAVATWERGKEEGRV